MIEINNLGLRIIQQVDQSYTIIKELFYHFMNNGLNFFSFNH